MIWTDLGFLKLPFEADAKNDWMSRTTVWRPTGVAKRWLSERRLWEAPQSAEVGLKEFHHWKNGDHHFSQALPQPPKVPQLGLTVLQIKSSCISRPSTPPPYLPVKLDFSSPRTSTSFLPQDPSLTVFLYQQTSTLVFIARCLLPGGPPNWPSNLNLNTSSSKRLPTYTLPSSTCPNH